MQDAPRALRPERTAPVWAVYAVRVNPGRALGVAVVGGLVVALVLMLGVGVVMLWLNG